MFLLINFSRITFPTQQQVLEVCEGKVYLERVRERERERETQGKRDRERERESEREIKRKTDRQKEIEKERKRKIRERYMFEAVIVSNLSSFSVKNPCYV